MENFVRNGENVGNKHFLLFEFFSISFFIMGRKENFVRNGENVGNEHFLLFPHFFNKLPCHGKDGKLCEKWRKCW